MAIQHRPGRDKPYLVRLRDPGGKEFSRGFTLKRDAKRWEAEQRAALARGDWTDPAAGRITMNDWSGRWLESLDVAPATRSQRESLLRCHILPRFGDWPLRAITRVEIEGWRTSMLDRGLARSTVHQAVLVLSLCLSSAVDSEVIAKNPAKGVRRVGQDDEAKAITKMRILRPDEAEAVAVVCDPAYRAAFWTGILGGLRIGEIAGLSASRVTDGVLVVDRAVSEVAGKTSMGPTKSRRRRTLTMSDRLIDELLLHQRLFPTGDSGLLFTNRSGGLLSRSWFNLRILRPAVARSIGGHLHAHDLRHTNAALLIAAGIPMKAVAERLGHASVVTTDRYYGHLFPEVERAAAVALDVAFAGTERASHLRVV